MLQLLRRLTRQEIDQDGQPDPSRPDAAPALPSTEIEFAAYAEDCRIFGFIRLETERLSDALNERDEYQLHDVMVVALADGRATEVRELAVHRDEVMAVRAAGPRGNAGRRSRRRPSPVTIRTGPYTIHGYVHAPPGADPVQQLRRRKAMVPLTEAWIEYVSGGQSHQGRAGTLIINRELIDWVARSRDEEVRMPDLPAETAPDPLAKDLTGYILSGRA